MAKKTNEEQSVYPGYTQEQVEEWEEYLPLILEVIGDGLYDSQLKEIAKAVVDRRAKLLKSKPSSDHPARGVASVDPKTSQAVGAVTDILGENGLKVKPTAVRASTIQVGPYRYRKSELLGNKVRLPAIGKAWFIENLLCEIIKVDTTNITVRALEDATVHHPSSYKAKEYTTGKLIKLGAHSLSHIFETN